MEDRITAMIATAPMGVLDDLVRATYADALFGRITEAEADAIHTAINARRAVPSLAKSFSQRPSIFPPRRRQPRPDASAVMKRRRRVAASGALPSKLASHFTPGEIAVLSVIAMEVRRNDRCTLCNDEIAAKSGTSRSTVKNALREAKRLGFIAVTMRPRRGAKNLPNVVEITDGAWLTWLRRDGPVEDRGQNSGPHEYPQNLSIGAERKSQPAGWRRRWNERRLGRDHWTEQPEADRLHIG